MVGGGWVVGLVAGGGETLEVGGLADVVVGGGGLALVVEGGLVLVFETLATVEDEVGLTTESGGKSSSFVSVCDPITPSPIMTGEPIEGTPLTTTKQNAGPGGKSAAFGGICRTCSVAEPSAL